jgi:dual specificity phosphatase 12
VRDIVSFLLVEIISMEGVPDAHEIVSGIWLGNKRAALNDKWLIEKNISVVFNATKDVIFSTKIKKQYRIPVNDNLQAEEIRNMTLWSHEIIYNLLKEYNSGATILVHCAAGMQRSAAIVAMFLIAKNRYSWNQAIAYIQNIRSIAFRPSANFEQSIIAFDNSYHREILPKLTLLEL